MQSEELRLHREETITLRCFWSESQLFSPSFSLCINYIEFYRPLLRKAILRAIRIFSLQMISRQSWALEVFLNFFTDKKLFFAFFIKLIWLGVGFLNKTGEEIGYLFYFKNAIKSFCIIEKNKIYLKCPALFDGPFVQRQDLWWFYTNWWD